MAGATLTWLGHSAFRLDTSAGKRIYVDPFLNGNPKCPEDEREPERADIVAVTHGHGDHVGDTVDIAKKHGSTVVAIVELSGWLGKQGVDDDKLPGPNKGWSSPISEAGILSIRFSTINSLICCLIWLSSIIKFTFILTGRNKLQWLVGGCRQS